MLGKATLRLVNCEGTRRKTLVESDVGHRTGNRCKGAGALNEPPYLHGERSADRHPPP